MYFLDKGSEKKESKMFKEKSFSGDKMGLDK